MKRLKLIFLSLLISLHINAFDEFLVSDIRIVGLQRVSTGSIFNVIPISVGDRIDQRKSNDIVRSLFATEQFDNIQIGKEGNTLIITVEERPSISAIELSGNKALKTEQLLESLDGVGIKEGEVYKRSTLEKVKSELVRSYSANGRYGATVEIEDDDSGEKMKYQIVGEYESDIENNKLSVSSPLARGLINKSVDDIVEINSPKGQKSYTIKSVKYI